MRRLLSTAAVWVTWPLQRSHLRAKDPMSGFFMVRRRCLPEGAFQKSGFKLLLEILVRGRIQSVKEVPFAFGLRYRGASKANFRVAWDYGLLLTRLYAGKIGLGRGACARRSAARLPPADRAGAVADRSRRRPSDACVVHEAEPG